AAYTGARSQYFATFDAATGTYVVDDLREGSPDGTDQVRNVETFVFADGAIAAESVLDGNPGPIIGADGDDTLSGTSLGEEIRGLGGSDTLSGLGGEDLLDGGDGDDALDGGTGVDSATYASAGLGVVVSLAVAGAQDTGGAGNDTLVSIENLTGSAFDDKLAGNDTANQLSGLAGSDRLDGAGRPDPLVGGGGGDIPVGGSGRRRHRRRRGIRSRQLRDVDDGDAGPQPHGHRLFGFAEQLRRRRIGHFREHRGRDRFQQQRLHPREDRC